MLGLYGSSGISPISSVVEQGRGQPPLLLMLSYPSIFWFGSSDGFLTAVPILGAGVAFLAMLGLLTGPMLFIAWFLYLSIVTVGQEFMSFQWDILLLETGFLCVFFATWKPFDFLYNFTAKLKLPAWAIDQKEPSIVLVWLFRWLLFRLMFQSGMCKLDSMDETWRNLTAMTYHYETQPLPTPLGWFAHQMPDQLQLVSTGMVFVFELFVPFLIFCGRKARCAAFIGLVLLQILILLTGNYTFFNWLTIAFCLLLLDDSLLANACGKRLSTLLEGVPEVSSHKLRLMVVVPLAVLLVSLSSSRTITKIVGMDTPLYAVMSLFSPWHLTSSYGLFAVMTTSRPEISIEGSNDGKEWKEYVFKFKPGPLNRPPPIVAPHQPRLDWQMWFASLGTVFDNQWLVVFCQRLLENKTDVIGLLETNPFPDAPPKFIRAVVYDYHMTDIPTLMKTGAWWTRTYKSVYLPPISLTETSL